MSYRLSPALEQLVQERMASGRYESEEDLLRDALRALDEQDGDLAAIQEAIDGLEAGDEGIPAEVVFEELRAKYNIPRE